MKRLGILIVLLLFGVGAGAQQYSREDSLRVEKLLHTLSASEKPEVTMTKAAQLMIGTPYVANLLGLGDELEVLKTPVVKTDCILFVETMLAVVRTVHSGGGFNDFTGYILDSRYRDGKVAHFSDRVHYTTEWIRRLEANGVLKDITMDLGGVVFDHPINYMSNHPAAYKMSQEDLQQIKATEESLNKIPLCYIPKDKIDSVKDSIQSGDIVCFVTSTEGLDISHVAIAYKYKEYHGSVNSTPTEELGFIHASSAAGKVIIDPRTIAQYLSTRKTAPGIKVLRIQ